MAEAELSIEYQAEIWHSIEVLRQVPTSAHFSHCPAFVFNDRRQACGSPLPVVTSPFVPAMPHRILAVLALSFDTSLLGVTKITTNIAHRSYSL